MKSPLSEIIDKMRSDFSKTSYINPNENVMTPETITRVKGDEFKKRLDQN